MLRYIYLCSMIEWSGAYCFCPVCLFFFCLYVCLSVCLLSTLTFAITFEFKRGGDFIFSMHTPLIKPFQMTPRSMTLWPWLWPWSKNGLLDFVANRGIVFYKHTLLFFTLKLLPFYLDFNFWPNFEKSKMLYHNYFITGYNSLGMGSAH